MGVISSIDKEINNKGDVSMPWRKTVSIILCIMLCITSVMSGCSKDKDKDKDKNETQNTTDTMAKINLQVEYSCPIHLQSMRKMSSLIK